MRSVNRDSATLLTVCVIVGVFFAAHFFQRHVAFDGPAIWSDLDASVFGTTLLVGVFLAGGWKATMFRRWLVLVADLTGHWTGSITPVRDEPSQESLMASVNVHQTLSQVSVLMWTTKAKSTSYAGMIGTDGASGEQRLIYAYVGDAYLDNRSGNPHHDGAANLVVSNRGERLSGWYWTDRQTRGLINLVRRSHKTAPDPEAALRDFIASETKPEP